MNYLDLILIVPLIWAAWRGFNKGLIIEISSLIALGLGVWGGVHFSDFAAELITGKVDDQYVSLVSFSITFIAIVAAVYVIGKMLEKVINIVQLKLVNKITGAGFGVAKVALIMSVLLVIINSYGERFGLIPEEVKEGSVLYEPMSEMSLKVIPALEDSGIIGPNTQQKADSVVVSAALSSL